MFPKAKSSALGVVETLLQWEYGEQCSYFELGSAFLSNGAANTIGYYKRQRLWSCGKHARFEGDRPSGAFDSQVAKARHRRIGQRTNGQLEAPIRAVTFSSHRDAAVVQLVQGVKVLGDLLLD